MPTRYLSGQQIYSVFKDFDYVGRGGLFLSLLVRKKAKM